MKKQSKSLTKQEVRSSKAPKGLTVDFPALGEPANVAKFTARLKSLRHLVGRELVVSSDGTSVLFAAGVKKGKKLKVCRRIDALAKTYNIRVPGWIHDLGIHVASNAKRYQPTKARAKVQAIKQAVQIQTKRTYNRKPLTFMQRVKKAVRILVG